VERLVDHGVDRIEMVHHHQVVVLEKEDQTLLEHLEETMAF
jgi:hypothetical protein